MAIKKIVYLKNCESCEIGISKVRFFVIMIFVVRLNVHVLKHPEFRLFVQISDLEDLIRIPQSSDCI